MLAWLKDKAAVIGALTGAVVATIAILQIVIVGPMDQRFDDMNQRFNDMNQRFNGTNQRIDDLRADMNNRFDQQSKYINARFDAVDRRLGRLENDVSELRSLSDRVSRNEGQIDIHMEQVQTTPQPVPSP